MENEVDEQEGIADGGERMEEKGCEGKENGEDAKPKVDVKTNLLAFFLTLFVTQLALLGFDDAHDNGALATEKVLVTVAVVVDHEEVVGGETHCEGCEKEGEVKVES